MKDGLDVHYSNETSIISFNGTRLGIFNNTSKNGNIVQARFLHHLITSVYSKSIRYNNCNDDSLLLLLPNNLSFEYYIIPNTRNRPREVLSPGDFLTHATCRITEEANKVYYCFVHELLIPYNNQVEENPPRYCSE